MANKWADIPQGHLHTPEEMLQGAEFLLNSENPTMLRAAVLEAFSALETYAGSTALSTLERRVYPPALAETLKRQLDDRLDSRLELLASAVVGHQMDPQLKKDFNEAKQIRNRVTHAGIKVSAPEARFVLKTVYKMLAYLGSNLELDLALAGFKRHIEDNKVPIETEEDAICVVRNYFGANKGAYAYTEMPKITSKRGHPQLRCDLILEFGPYRALVEVRCINGIRRQQYFATRMKVPRDWMHGAWAGMPPLFMDLVADVRQALDILMLQQGIVIVFLLGGQDNSATLSPHEQKGRVVLLDNHETNLERYSSLQKFENERVYSLFVNV